MTTTIRTDAETATVKVLSTEDMVIRSGRGLDLYLRSTFSTRLPSLSPTEEILSDPFERDAVLRGLAQARRGEGRPWREVFAELD